MTKIHPLLALRHLLQPVKRAGQRIGLSLGRFASTEPLSRCFGFDRGLPIDRYYIEHFLLTRAADIKGRVLEVGDDSYSRRFGRDRILQQDVLHVHADNPKATIVGDIAAPNALPEASFDCIVLTQTLHLVYDMKAAVEQIRKALKQGGVALVTVPGITPVDRGEWATTWYWSLTSASAHRLFAEAFGTDSVTVVAFGNVFAATAFLHGAALEEVDAAKLNIYDEAFPVIVAIRAEAPSVT